MTKIVQICMFVIVSLFSLNLKAQWLLTGNNVTPAQFLGTIAGDTDPLIFKTSGIERMRMLSNGNIGIGTTNPSSRLEVKGTIVSGSVDNISEGGEVLFSGAGNYPYFYIDNYKGDMRIITNGNPEVVRFYMNNAGNIGIGTTAPGSYKLAVEGKIGCREAVVTQSTWADFVFNDDYKLKPLSEVEKFIKENKHLPDVPSEKDIHQNGNNIGKTDAILLQKIEELTLYVIKINNENQMLRQRVSELEKDSL